MMMGLVVGKYKAGEFRFVGSLTRPSGCITAGKNYQPVNLFVVQFIRNFRVISTVVFAFLKND